MRLVTADRIDRYGVPGGKLVILFHGAVANRKTWLPLVEVAPPELDLWCPDLPGHGVRRDEPFTLASARVLIDDLIVAARPRRPILAGDSLGGYLALAAAARHRGEIAAVVAGGCTWSMTGARGALARWSDVPVEFVTRAVGERWAERVAQALVRRVTDAATAGAIVDAGFRLAARGESLRELAGMDLERIVRAIDVPIAFVNGRYDWPTRAGERELLAAARSATLTIGERCGHGVGFFDPHTFARAIAACVR